MPIASTEAEQREHVDREAEHGEEDEPPTSETGNGEQRISVRAASSAGR